MKKAADRGKAVHQSIENFLLFGIDDISPEHAGYYEAFKGWWKTEKPKLVATETRVYHKTFRYAGTVDMICILKGGEKVLVDFKTSAQVVDMLVSIQLEAYARAYESHGVMFDNKVVVHLKKDGECSMKTLPRHEATEDWEVFCSLLNVNNYLTKYGR
jgi:hypothetical protein